MGSKKNKDTDSIEDIVAHVNNAVKNSKIMLGDDDKLPLRRLETGILPLDNILGGGLPFGRVTIFAGPEQGGKTFLAFKAIEAAQKQGLTAAFIDVERTYDPAWAKTVGVDTSKLIYCMTSSGEEALDVAMELTRAKVGIIVLDSLAGLLPLAEKEEDMEQKFIGIQPLLINKGLRKIVQENSGDSIILLINQIRLTIGGWGNNEKLPGGMGQYFFASIILRINKGVALKEKDEKIGFTMKLFTEKNKTFKPQLKSEIPFMFSGKLDLKRVVVFKAIDIGIIEKNGSYFTHPKFPDGKILGKNGVLNYIETSEELYEELVEKVREYEQSPIEES